MAIVKIVFNDEIAVAMAFLALAVTLPGTATWRLFLTMEEMKNLAYSVKL
jgi:hypothetical protein